MKLRTVRELSLKENIGNGKADDAPTEKYSLYLDRDALDAEHVFSKKESKRFVNALCSLEKETIPSVPF